MMGQEPKGRVHSVWAATLAPFAWAARALVWRRRSLADYACPSCNYAATMRDIKNGQPLPCSKCGRIVYINH